MSKRTTSKAKSPKAPSNADRFLALPDAEKERIFQSYNREVPLSETRPMTPSGRRSCATTQASLEAGHAKPPATKRRGRPVVGLRRAERLPAVKADRGIAMTASPAVAKPATAPGGAKK